MNDYLVTHDWPIQLLALIPFLLIGYGSWRARRKKRLDPRTLPPMSADWRTSKDRHR